MYYILPCSLDILNVNSKAGVLKLLGTLICLMGTISLMFYQGATLIRSHKSSHSTISQQEGGPTRHDWMIGSVFLVTGCIAWSMWFLVQSKISKKYPALYSGTAVTFFLSFIQAAAFCLVTEKGVSAWIPQTKLQIITVVFAVSSPFDLSVSFSLLYKDLISLLNKKTVENFASFSKSTSTDKNVTV